MKTSAAEARCHRPAADVTVMQSPCFVFAVRELYWFAMLSILFMLAFASYEMWLNNTTFILYILFITHPTKMAAMNEYWNV